MAINLAPKAPAERIAYLWTPPLAAGDTINGAPTIAVISGTAATDGVSLVGTTQVKVYFNGGTDGETCEFLVTINTTGGETLQETLYLPINSTALSALGAKLVAIFSAFASVPNEAVNYWLEQSEIVANWGNDHAQMLLACHYMAINGLGNNPISGGLTSFKSGSVDMKFSEAKANTIGLMQTTYGEQFSTLLRRRHAGPRVISGGAVIC